MIYILYILAYKTDESKQRKLFYKVNRTFVTFVSLGVADQPKETQ